jgi:hypothetical protein
VFWFWCFLRAFAALHLGSSWAGFRAYYKVLLVLRRGHCTGFPTFPEDSLVGFSAP